MTTEQVRYLKIVSTNDREPIDVIGGPRAAISFITMVGNELDPSVLIQTISEEEAIRLLEPTKIGAGVYISDPFNIATDEKRRQASYEKLVEVGLRLGFGSIFNPVCIELRTLESQD